MTFIVLLMSVLVVILVLTIIYQDDPHDYL